MVVRRIKIWKRRGVSIGRCPLETLDVRRQRSDLFQPIISISLVSQEGKYGVSSKLMRTADFQKEYNKDPSTTLGMTMAKNPRHQSLVTSHA